MIAKQMVGMERAVTVFLKRNRSLSPPTQLCWPALLKMLMKMNNALNPSILFMTILPSLNLHMLLLHLKLNSANQRQKGALCLWGLSVPELSVVAKDDGRGPGFDRAPRHSRGRVHRNFFLCHLISNQLHECRRMLRRISKNSTAIVIRPSKN